MEKTIDYDPFNKCKCDYCGNPKYDREAGECSESCCYGFSRWTPVAGLSKEAIADCYADIEEDNWW